MKCVLPSGVTGKQAIIFFIAACQVLFGIVTLFFKQDIFDSILESQLIVKEGTKSFEAWQETPIPLYTEFYFFNMLNAEAFMKRGEKPRLEEKGPYTFRELEQKVNLVWREDLTVSYQRKKFWYFEPSMSKGSLDDTVTTLNLPMVGAAHAAKGNFFMEFGINDMLSTIEAQLFINKTIRELTFEGYVDPVMEMAASLEEEEEEPSLVLMDKFGWFYKRNGTTWSDGDLRMHTGQGDISKLGQIVSWNKSNRTEAFSGECGRVRGSADGLVAPGFLKTAKSFTLWSTDTCRTLTFDRNSTERRLGLDVTKFQLSDDAFANGTVCSSNGCYENNLPTGVQNVSQCKVKSPAFVSRPNFYKADDYFTSQFQSSMPQDPEVHESYMLVEPHTSIPIRVQMSLQLNVKLEPNPGIEYVFKSLPTVYFPVIWFKSTMDMPKDMAASVKALINIPNIMVVVALLGMSCGMGGIFLVIYRVRCSRKMDCMNTIIQRNQGSKGSLNMAKHLAVASTEEEKEVLRDDF